MLSLISIESYKTVFSCTEIAMVHFKYLDTDTFWDVLGLSKIIEDQYLL